MKILLLTQMFLCGAPPGPNPTQEKTNKINALINQAKLLRENVSTYNTGVLSSINAITADTVTWVPEIETSLTSINDKVKALKDSPNFPLFAAENKKVFNDLLALNIKELEDLNDVISAKIIPSTPQTLKDALDLKSKEVVEARIKIQELVIANVQEPGFFAKYWGWILFGVLGLILAFGSLYIYHLKVLNK